jgi:hypothetical protein
MPLYIIMSVLMIHFKLTRRLMACVSSNDPTLSTVLLTPADFHMARFLSKTLVSSMMDFNLRMEKKMQNKSEQSESSM